MKKIGYVICLALMLAACGKKDSHHQDAASVNGPNATGTPNVDTASMPDIAFDFRYVFSIPGEQISNVQEDHALACKKLGLSKCRITDLDYTANGDDVSAMMTFKIAPDLAIDFTRDAKKSVEKADGKLSSANLKGADVGTNIASGETSSLAARKDLSRIEDQLKNPALTKAVRSQLVEKAESLRGELRAIDLKLSEDKTALALTPVVFEYQQRNSIAGFDHDSAFGEAFSTSVYGFMAMLKILIVMLGVAAPWVIVIGGGIYAVRYFKRKTKAVTADSA